MEITRVSPLTQKTNTLDIPITELQLRAWEQGALIQQAAPHLTADEREFLISGLYPGEFERLWNE
jgi:hypothetical protein